MLRSYPISFLTNSFCKIHTCIKRRRKLVIYNFYVPYLEIKNKTPIRGLSIILKSAWDLVYPDEFSMHGKFCAIWLAVLRVWKLKNTDFAQKISTPNWWIIKEILTSHRIGRYIFLQLKLPEVWRWMFYRLVLRSNCTWKYSQKRTYFLRKFRYIISKKQRWSVLCLVLFKRKQKHTSTN